MQLALGTVQFGLAYGIAGNTQAVPPQEVRAILEDAASRGVRTLDTAAAYGDIEERLASLVGDLPFEIISKVPSIPDELTPEQAQAWALGSAQRSLDRLGAPLKGLMLHRASDLQGDRGDLVTPALNEWCSRHGIAFGASCYEAGQAAQLAEGRGIRLTQLPGNAFDQRVARAADALQDVDVHLRSAFLQGLLLMPLQQAQSRLPAASEILTRWHQRCAAADLQPLEAALGLVKSFQAVSTVLVGVDSLAQWRDIASAWAATQALTWPDLACQDHTIIDPRHWKTHS